MRLPLSAVLFGGLCWLALEVQAGCPIVPRDYVFVPPPKTFLKEDVLQEPGTPDGCWVGAGTLLQVVYARAKACRTTPGCVGFSLDPHDSGYRSCLLSKAVRPAVLPITYDRLCFGTFKRMSGQAIGWGNSQNGQIAIPYEATFQVAAVAAGGFHSLALLTSNKVVAWGMNDLGQGGVPLEAQQDAAAVAGGEYHSLVVLNSGRVVAWGSNDWGQTDVPQPAQSRVVDVSGGVEHSMALLETGEIVVWGNGDSLVVPAVLQQHTVAISAGLYHSLALLDNGTVLAWGYDRFTQASVPDVAKADVIAIAAGSGHSLALLSNGTVVAWGADKLGLTDVPDVARSNVVAISASIYYSLALLNNGTVVSWGSQIRQRLLQVPAAAMADVTAISSCAAHALAIVLPPPLPAPEQPKLHGGAIAGVVIGCIAVTAALAAGAFFFVRRRRHQRLSRSDAEQQGVSNPLLATSSLMHPLFSGTPSMASQTLTRVSSDASHLTRAHTVEPELPPLPEDEATATITITQDPHHPEEEQDNEPLLYPPTYEEPQTFYPVKL